MDMKLDILKKDGTFNHRGLADIHSALAELDGECSRISVEELLEHLSGRDMCSFVGEFSADWELIPGEAELFKLLESSGFEVYRDQDGMGNFVYMLDF
jgi:hypothetical protein